MDTMIALSVGRLETDWGKHFRFADHSQLFQPSDLTKIPYYYVDKDNPYNEDPDDHEYNLVTVLKDGLSKSLHQVIDRIDLLGYTMTHAKREFEYLSRLHDFDSKRFTFEQLAEALATIDVASISADYGDGEDFGKFFRRYLFDKLRIEGMVDDPHYVRYQGGPTLENLSPYTILRLVARNPSARDLPVSWHFADLEDEGWTRRTDFLKPVDQENRFLVVTEGSSDATIIAHAFKLLKPHVSDFFDFVDMNEGYPFTGTGNLYNFTKGLISISVRNNIIILYDNDAQGVSSFNHTVTLNVPPNMRILKLPDLQEFQNFKTIGPTGEYRADINGRAAAIECYLDAGSTAAVRWNNYQKELRVYHGELIAKRHVMRKFLKQSVLTPGYDYSKIATVLDAIVSACIAIREAARLADLGNGN